MRSLRRRLFGSHLLVMAVALVVLLVGIGVVFGLLSLISERSIGRTRRDDGGPFALLVGIIAAVIASALVSWRVTRQLAAPLEQLSIAAQSLAAGRYDIRLPSSDTAELDALANDVNHLASELESTEQRRLMLIGDVAHELRNPLATIEGTMEALLDGVMTPDDETFARVGREAARLRRLADDLSSLSHAGERRHIDLVPVDLSMIARDVTRQLEPQATAKDLHLATEGATSATVAGDADQLTQVMMNVIGNAVQYTDAGAVTVRVETRNDAAIVTIIDSGRGLSSEQRDRVFERFYRVEANYSDGTGVGLAIAKLIIDAHGGTIAVDSAGLGQGTSVVVHLPLR